MLQAFRNALQAGDLSHSVIDGKNDSVDCKSIRAAIVWLPPDNFFKDLSNLETVYAISAGVDQLLLHPGLPGHVDIIRLRDAGMASQMAEYVLYGALRVQRNFHEFEVAQRSGQWQHGMPVRKAEDTSIGILGSGVLGRAVASRLVENRYAVSCWSRTAKSLPAGISSFFGEAELDSFLEPCDVLVCLLALTDSTTGMLNASLFKKLKKGAYIINVARGKHLVDVDLLNAIDEGQLSGAMLDVFQQEPLAQDHPFWTHPRITVTPHEAARSLADKSVSQIVDSIFQVERGESPDGLVSRSRGY